MPKARQSLIPALISFLTLLAPPVPLAHAQAASTTDAGLPLSAVLVLTPDFCATTFKQGSVWTTGRDTLTVGKMACDELAPALKPAFASLTVASAPPPPGDAQLVLIPKFANAHTTTSAFAFSNREMDVYLQWTITDAVGKTVWLQTVEGSSKHHEGNLFTHGRNVKLIVTDSVRDAANESVIKMEASPELRKLTPADATAAK